MTDPTTVPVNQGAQLVDNTLRGLLTVILAGLETALDTAEPIFAAPVIKQVVDEILSLIEQKAESLVIAEATYLVLKFQGWAELNAYQGSEGALQAAIATGNPTIIAQAKAAFDAIADKEIASKGSAS